MKFGFFALLVFSALLLSHCESKQKATEIFPVKSELTHGWIVYEGFVPIAENQNLFIAVSMRAGDSGEGDYKLEEAIYTANVIEALPTLHGKYSSLVGATPEEVIVYVHRSVREKPIKRIYPSVNGKKIREEFFRHTDLAFRRSGDGRLIVLNSNSEPLTLEPKFNLTKRISPLFTVEGYFAHTGDSSIFLEMNTNQRWPISKRGAYEEAVQGYYALTEKKFESVYLKAVGYSILDQDKNGRVVESLVLKRVLQMSSAPENL
jgi:hypothetical protein